MKGMARKSAVRTQSPENNIDPFQAQHRLSARRQIRLGSEEIVVEVNDGESPLGWLRRRKGGDGKPLLSESQFEAGERLRRDFTIGQMTPRVTADWSRPISGGAGRPRDPAEIAHHALAARQRVSQAVGAVGPGLSDILLSVCCHLQGLEAAERGFGWPKRAGKLVLQIALDRLAAHYGIEERA